MPEPTTSSLKPTCKPTEAPARPSTNIDSNIAPPAADDPTSAAAKTPESSVQQPLEDLKKQLTEKEAQCTEWKDKYIRMLAELDNERKRSIKDQDAVRFQTMRKACLSIIELFDSFKIGLESAQKQGIPFEFLKGFQMIFQQFQTQLKTLGIEEIHADGNLFDPHWHTALSHVPHETIPEGHVVTVLQAGYKYSDKLLRPAAVVVSNGKAPADAVHHAGNAQDGSSASPNAAD